MNSGLYINFISEHIVLDDGLIHESQLLVSRLLLELYIRKWNRLKYFYSIYEPPFVALKG